MIKYKKYIKFSHKTHKNIYQDKLFHINSRNINRSTIVQVIINYSKNLPKMINLNYNIM